MHEATQNSMPKARAVKRKQVAVSIGLLLGGLCAMAVWHFFPQLHSSGLEVNWGPWERDPAVEQRFDDVERELARAPDLPAWAGKYYVGNG